MAAGDIESEIQTLCFETGVCEWPEIIHVAGDAYAMVYRSTVSPYGLLQTFTISSEGAIALVDSLGFDVSSLKPRITHVAGDVYAIVYSGSGQDGWARTVEIQSDGTITGLIASFEFDTGFGAYPAIIHVSGDVYLIVYWGSGSIIGFIRTIRISDDGNTIESISAKVQIAPDLKYAEILHVSGDVFAYVYKVGANGGNIETRKVYSDGSIEASPEDTFAFDAYVNPQETDLSFIHISGDVFAVVYTGAPYSGGSGWLKTVGIQTDGIITGEIDSFEFDVDQAAFPSTIHVAGDAYIIAYMGYGGAGGNRGVYRSLEIASNGTIGNIIDTELFGSSAELYPDIIHVVGDVYVCAYRRPVTSDGWLRTFGVDTPAEAARRHRFTGGIQHRALH